ncbi:response regulator [Candidatus Paracaedibacter symbiosus]|uniref:response regulator n=1 Tax=Candidatus Paracaedibacter symbiosus TaxID=244582 RepID=UPI0005094ACB|nr:response regulator [Candidatus Paracaedibacter symbiosus]
MKFIPAFYFPTTVHLVDDEYEFLKEMKWTLDPSVATYNIFPDPQVVLEHIGAQQGEGTYINQWLKEGEMGSIVAQVYDLYKQIYSLQRFSQVSTVVVDYDMPLMNGLELCEKITSPHIQKILLTGAADDNLAIHAFNKGLIHGFIRKHDPNVIQLLEEFIKKGQQQFFQSLTKTYMTAVTMDRENTFLLQPEFVKLFERLVRENKVTEYYLKDHTGQFIFLNEKGEMGALFVYQAEVVDIINHELITQAQRFQGENAQFDRLLKDLKNRKKMVVENCFEEQMIFTDPEILLANAHEVHGLEGVPGCYWFLMPFKNSTNAIVSWEKFRYQEE